MWPYNKSLNCDDMFNTNGYKWYVFVQNLVLYERVKCIWPRAVLAEDDDWKFGPQTRHHLMK